MGRNTADITKPEMMLTTGLVELMRKLRTYTRPSEMKPVMGMSTKT